MRVLNKKQKNLIDKWIKEHYNGAGSLYSSDQMPIELQQELESINDHETIWSNIDRYINDKTLEIVHKR